MQNNLSDLIIRAEKLEDSHSIIVFNIEHKELDSISNNLSLILPLDFREINIAIGHASFNSMEFFRVTQKSNGIIRNNLEIRKQYIKDSEGKSDMSHILVLADDDGGSVFMITQDSLENPTPVIWCDYGDMYYYSIHKEFRNPHDEWPSFTAFFEYLVEQEEQKLREDLS